MISDYAFDMLLKMILAKKAVLPLDRTCSLQVYDEYVGLFLGSKIMPDNVWDRAIYADSIQNVNNDPSMFSKLSFNINSSKMEDWQSPYDVDANLSQYYLGWFLSGDAHFGAEVSITAKSLYALNFLENNVMPMFTLEETGLAPEKFIGCYTLEGKFLLWFRFSL